MLFSIQLFFFFSLLCSSPVGASWTLLFDNKIQVISHSLLVKFWSTQCTGLPSLEATSIIFYLLVRLSQQKNNVDLFHCAFVCLLQQKKSKVSDIHTKSNVGRGVRNHGTSESNFSEVGYLNVSPNSTPPDILPWNCSSWVTLSKLKMAKNTG